jgi:ADP-ribosylglycohydrolase
MEDVMKKNARAMLIASFAADALALGGHWVYNASVIEKKYGRMEQYEEPLGHSYHPTKGKGDFTHYGDQMLLLLETIAEKPGFGLVHFFQAWKDFFENYDGYVDKATTETLENFARSNTHVQCGSSSTDLGGAARIAPLVYFYQDQKDALLSSAHAQTVMTHNHAEVNDSAIFFSEVVWRVLNGTPPTEAIQEVITAEEFDRSPIKQWVLSAMDTIGSDTTAVIADFGQMCASPASFPGVIHLIVKYENRLKDALVENVMAGGDSAARGMLTGMVLGAYHGIEAIPEKWITELTAYNKIKALLNTIDRYIGK